MTRKLKALGSALLAALAIGAIVASTGSQAEFDEKGVFNENGAKTVITGEGETVFSTKIKPELKITCQVAVSGTADLPAGQITLRPTFKECNGFGVTKVDTTGCGIIFFGETTEYLDTNGEKRIDSPIEFDCEGGKSITITTTTCNITIPAPGGERFHGAYYDSEGQGATSDVKITATVDQIKYTTPDTLGCTLSGLPRNGADATLTTTPGQGITIRGYEDMCKEEGGKDVECPFVPAGGTDKDTYTDGAQTGIWWEGV